MEMFARLGSGKILNFTTKLTTAVRSRARQLTFNNLQLVRSRLGVSWITGGAVTRLKTKLTSTF